MHIPRFKAIAFAGLAATLSSHAELLVYEPFDYATVNDPSFGRVAGRNGGLGFGGAWQDSTIGSNGGEAFVFDARANPQSLYDGVWGAGLPTWNGVVTGFPTLGGYAGLSDWSNQGAGEDRLNSHRPLARGAGAMAAANGGVLWLSAVWHFQDSGFFAPVGIALTANGSYFTERARNLVNSGIGIGVAAGNDFNSETLTKDLNPIFFSGGNQSAKTTGTNISTTQDNIILLKFEFGATDTVRAWYFTEGQTMTEALFNTNAKSVTATIDESTLTTLAFSTIRAGNAVDEFRIGTTFNDVISGTVDPRQALEITGFDYNKTSDELTLTWKSNPGETYGVYGSEDLKEFRPYVAPAVNAHPTARQTTLGPVANPNPGAGRFFLQVGLPDLAPPAIERVWGINSTISVDFTEPMLPALATNPARYAVVKSGGGAVAISSAAFHPANDTVVLTTAAPLEPGTAYTVTMSGLTDLAARPLANPVAANFRTWDDDPGGIKVFILAGQSNMVGYGESELGTGSVAGATGSLRHKVNTDPANYGHLVNGSGGWLSRPDVKVWWNKADVGAGPNIVKGDLTVGFGSNTARIGPEYGFGWVVGDRFAEPILLIKTSWGGKDLFTDFRPPSAVAARGGKVGRYYVEMMEQVHEVLDNLGTEFPGWAGQGYQITGFGWHQGWNDRLNAVMSGDYQANLADLIRDVRAEFGRPGLPVSIATSGMDSGTTRTPVELAQLAVANPALYPAFGGKVLTVDTRAPVLWRDPAASPANEGFHWNRNGETYFLIGDSMGKGMVDLLDP